MTHTAHLKDRRLLKVSGADCVEFLQNLITCEVASLDPGASRFGALLTPQGKILFDFFVLREADGYLLDVDAGQADALAQRLTFYKLRAAVDISADPRSVFASWPDGEGVSDARTASMGTRHYGETIPANATLAQWHGHRIGIGVPHLGLDFDPGENFPHDVLMDQFDHPGVDFRKGCYVGQEVVSRMEHRGTARSRFVKVMGDQPLPPKGEPLALDGRRVGTLGSSVDCQGLALVRLDRAGQASDSRPILIDGSKVTLSLPEFVSFDWPETEAGFNE